MNVKILKSIVAAFICLFLSNILQAQKKKAAPKKPVIETITATTADERLKSFELKKQMAANSPFKTAFKNVGPNVMSGRVVDLDVNPTDPTEFYVAYATGGAWHTINNGQSFTPIFDNENVIGLGDITVNWKERIIWLGTGEANSSRSSYSGIGVYKSSNNGKTWQYLGLPESHHIGKIILHPSDANTAWVASLGHLYTPNKERGVYKTTDGGTTWKQTLFIDENTGCIEMDINPSNPNELMACMWYKTRTAWNLEEAGKTSGIYKSTDGGNSWNLITIATSGFPTGDGIGRIGVAYAASNSSVVYAIVDNQNHMPDTSRKKTDSLTYVKNEFKGLTKETFALLNNKRLDTFLTRSRLSPKYTAAILKRKVAIDSLKPTALYDYLYDANDDLFNTPILGAEVYKSNDGGANWTKTNTKPLTLYNTYGYYFGRIFTSPANENKVFIVGISAEMSTDGGKIFKAIGKRNTHSDHHVFWINKNRDSHLILGNDGGVNITYDNGDNWYKANQPPVGQFYAIETDNATPYRVYGGLQDNGVWYGYTTRQQTSDANYDSLKYASLGGGDGMMVQVDKRDNSTVYSGSQFGAYGRQNTVTGQRIAIRPQNEIGEDPFRFNWMTPIVLSKHQPDVFYMGTNKLHRSLEKGANITPISTDLTNGKKEGDVPFGTITTISESPIKFGLLYTGTDDGNVHISKDGGYTFTLINTGLPKGLWVSRVIASRFKEERVYVTFSGLRNDHFAAYVFVSNDYGNTWTQLCKNLPQESVNVIREDPKMDSVLYIGTDGGFYVSKNNGTDFMSWNKGLPKSVPIHDINIQERENEILLGTHGRSIYVASLNEIHGLPEKRRAPAGGRFRGDDEEN